MCHLIVLNTVIVDADSNSIASPKPLSLLTQTEIHLSQNIATVGTDGNSRHLKRYYCSYCRNRRKFESSKNAIFVSTDRNSRHLKTNSRHSTYCSFFKHRQKFTPPKSLSLLTQTEIHVTQNIVTVVDTDINSRHSTYCSFVKHGQKFTSPKSLSLLTQTESHVTQNTVTVDSDRNSRTVASASTDRKSRHLKYCNCMHTQKFHVI